MRLTLTKNQDSLIWNCRSDGSIKGGTKDGYLFDSWFDSKKAAESTMEVGAELIGMVETNTKGL